MLAQGRRIAPSLAASGSSRRLAGLHNNLLLDIRPRSPVLPLVEDINDPTVEISQLPLVDGQLPAAAVPDISALLACRLATSGRQPGGRDGGPTVA